MSDELVTPENLSQELLKSIFDAAFMDTSFDDEGDLRVTDGGIRCFVFPRKDRIRLLSLFGATSGARREDLLEFANNVNAEYLFIRTSILDNGRIAFDYDLSIRGGVSMKSIVLLTKRFLGIPTAAINEYGDHLVD